MVGRATAALYVTLRVLGRRSGKVVIPAVSCPHPANAALYAGLEPIFCDVRLDDFTIDPGALERLMGRHHDIVAVVAVHLYGHPADMDAVLALGARYGVPIIEDVAQALGGSRDGRPLGSFGECSVLSFGHTKIIDAGFGGAVLTDDATLASRLRDEVRALPARPADAAEMAQRYRRVYYALWALAEQDPALHLLFLPLPEVFRPLYLFGFDPGDAPGLLSALGGLPAAVETRRRNAALYRRSLTHPLIQHPRPADGAVPWRYTLLILNGQGRDVAREMRDRGFDASTWYPAVHRWFRSGRAQSIGDLTNALYLERCLLNLWVDPGTTADRIAATCAALQGVLEAEAAVAGGRPS
jgi:dTDP-4-amino-4,6-dideoxygalactose transaminase